MIPQDMVMCRESRKILDELGNLASKYNITTLVTPSEIMMADFMCLRYYTNPVINVIRTRIKTMKSKNSKHFTVEYWLNVISKILYCKNGTCRDYSVGLPGNIDSFALLSKYLIVDYSIADAYDIYTMITTHTQESIRNAIRIAKQNNVYNIQYLRTIIEKERAISNIKNDKLQVLINKENDSNKILDRVKVVNTEEDMEEVKDNWEKMQENATLEKMFNEIYK